MSGQIRCSQWFGLKNRHGIVASVFLFVMISGSHISEAVTHTETNSNNIDLSEPAELGPFHDLTTKELTQVMSINFLFPSSLFSSISMKNKVFRRETDVFSYNQFHLSNRSEASLWFFAHCCVLKVNNKIIEEARNMYIFVVE